MNPNPQHQQLGSLTGRITTTSGEPLAGAKVIVGRPMDRQYSGISGGDGFYVVEAIFPGHHQVWVELTGYSTVERNPITFGPGSTVNGIDFKLGVQSSVAGKVVDENGQPLSGVSVSLLFRDATGRVFPVHDPAFPNEKVTKTDESGNFRLQGVRPRKYFLLAVPAPIQPYISTMTATVSTIRSSPDEVALAAFYPGVEDFSKATEIEVSEGEHVMDLRLPLRRVRPYRVSGHIEFLNDIRPRSARVDVDPSQIGINLAGAAMGVQFAMSGSFSSFGRKEPEVRETFDFWLLPGSYLLKAVLNEADLPFPFRNPNEPGQQTSLFIEVTDHDLEGLIISFRGQSQVDGVVRLSRPGDDSIPNGLRLFMRPVSQRGRTRFAPTPIDVSTAGTFSLQYLPPGRYLIDVQFGHEEIGVKSLRYSGLEVAGPEFEVLQGENGKLEVIAPFTLGEVVGAVTLDDNGTPQRLTVFLAKVAQPTVLFRLLNCDETGHFQELDIPPGEYLTGVLIPNFGGIPKRDQVTRVTVHPNERITLNFSAPRMP